MTDIPAITETLLGGLLFTLIVLALSSAVIAARAILLPSHRVTVTVNGERNLVGRAGGKLLGFLHDGGVPLPSACAGAGTCGLCRIVVKSGGGAPVATEIDKFSRRELREGARLACQVVVRGDMAIEAPAELLGAGRWSCALVSARGVAPFIKELTFDLPSGETLDFRAGAFVTVTAPAYRLAFDRVEIDGKYQQIWDRYGLRKLAVESRESVVRAYSLANRPSDRGRVVLNVRLALPPPGAGESTPPGIVSSYLFALKPGDTATLAGPYGEFRAADSDREMVFIGGGVGMAPLRAIIFDQLERAGTTRKISFWYGARSAIDLFYREEFDGLQKSHENFRWTPALSDPPPEDDWDGQRGFIHEVAFREYLKDHPAPEDCEYYLCGPPLMIQAVLAMLDDLGVESDRIFNDDFGN